MVWQDERATNDSPPGEKPYIYTPLPPSAQTRVIILEPASDPSDPLHCDIEEIQLQGEFTGQGYEALSYTWGEPNLGEVLTVGHEKEILHITANLRDALRRLRLLDKPRRLWVDAVCINQEDESEKGRQIPMMSQIYRAATGVCVWLGNFPRQARNLALIKDMPRRIGKSTQSGQWHSSEMLSSMSELIKLPWFSRRWIVQEVVLNADVVMYCCDEELTWVQLTSRFRYFDKISSEHQAFETLLAMANLWKQWVFDDGHSSSIIALLEAFGHFECFEGKDRIYALAGLASDVDLNVKKFQGLGKRRKKNRVIWYKQLDSEGSGSTRQPQRIPLPVSYNSTTEALYTNFGVSVWEFGSVQMRNDLLRSALARGYDPENEAMPSCFPDWRRLSIRKPFVSDLKYGYPYSYHLSDPPILALTVDFDPYSETEAPDIIARADLQTGPSNAKLADMWSCWKQWYPKAALQDFKMLLENCAKAISPSFSAEVVDSAVSWSISRNWEETRDKFQDNADDLIHLLPRRLLFCCHHTDKNESRPVIDRDMEQLLTALETKAKTGKNAGKLPPLQSQPMLEQILAHTRTKTEAYLAPLFTKRGLEILGRYAFDDSKAPESVVALRCLNNALVRSVPTRRLFVDEGYPEKVLELMKNENPDQELATANLLIFCVTQSNLDLSPKIEHGELATIINKNMLRHSKSLEPLPSDPASPALATLRLLSTLATLYEKQASQFLDSLDPLLEMLNKLPEASSHVALPLSSLLSCLFSIPIHKSEGFPVSAVDKVVQILRTAIRATTRPAMEKELLPLLMIFLHIAQSNSPLARSKLSEHLLPSDTDRAQPLGQGESLPHKVLKLSSSTVELELREVIYTLFFELSERDPSQFVHNVGFGHAAGYLSSQGIQLSPDTVQGSDGAPDVNPITGQRRAAEPQTDLPEMLRANGMISVENPVAQAHAQSQNSGRVEELPDSDSD
ncbi:hypothetical protein NM208_g7604 [Fusarium decemcellulare]|uniref:Uncharacterized protein n=1 Tax=Fusarium decemcellulare TaxID=57161 RepID=A0ACC1S8I2_9HYPO|nr:hypothetical protein NM208_g7604 [Fusarium decemcellulare]